MVYNALLGQYKEINGYENGAPTYKANGTLAKAKFDVIDKKGVLTATSKTSVSSTDVQTVKSKSFQMMTMKLSYLTVT